VKGVLAVAGILGLETTIDVTLSFARSGSTLSPSSGSLTFGSVSVPEFDGVPTSVTSGSTLTLTDDRLSGGFRWDSGDLTLRKSGVLVSYLSAPVAEPATVALIMAGLCGVAGLARRRSGLTPTRRHHPGREAQTPYGRRLRRGCS
jgi:hypothetical protein